MLPDLPISGILSDLQSTLETHHQLVLEAPPGAGKTTLVPLALLGQEWLQGNKIVMLEPRRMAARAAAERMASLLGETAGQTVGYRVRQEVRVSRDTVIEVITGGILTRWLQEDPSLEGVGLVIFDEFHERHLDSDLGLALCLQGRELFRGEQTPLRLLVMSATLNGDAVATLLNGAPVIRSQGKAFPVDIIYSRSRKLSDSLVEPVADSVLRALREESGNILVFLPGQGEIRQVLRSLEGRTPDTVRVMPLHGGLSLDEQRMAIAPPPAGPDVEMQRKVVLATDIAESSLTIEGVRIVIDAGLTREPSFDPVTGMTRLVTRRLSQASSTQRCGRAGRLEAGLCYRLWSEEQQQQLAPYSTPEILQADLAPLALHLLNWGIDKPEELRWLNSPPPAAFQQGVDLLKGLAAIAPNQAGGWQLTDHGRQMSSFPAHPRLAHLLLCARQRDLLALSAQIAAILSEPPRADDSADIAWPLGLMNGGISASGHHRTWLRRTRKQASVFAQLGEGSTIPELNGIAPEDAPGYLLACAYPDRIGKRRPGQHNLYQLSNGRSAKLAEGDALTNSEWLACAEVGGFAGKREDRIILAAPLNPALFHGPLKPLTFTQDLCEWDQRADRFIAESRRQIGALTITRQVVEKPDENAKLTVLLDLVRRQGLGILPWNHDLRQWQARVLLLRSQDEQNSWPDVSNEGLLLQLDHWLAPYLERVNRLTDFAQLDLKMILGNLLPWPLPQQLDQLAPTAIDVPSGSRVAIDYLQTPPVLAVKLQEMFGCGQTPAIARGKVRLMLHLLSPARRPLQITQDLPSFWRTGYTDVKKDMKGRYPKHPWPDDPLQALPTRKVKGKVGH
jgi:ATP-dependent helicase HrpB